LPSISCFVSITLIPSLLLYQYITVRLLTHSLTHSLTPYSTVLEKPTGLPLVKKFTPFCGTRRFITAFTSAANCLYPKPAQSSPCPTSHFLKVVLNIIPPSTSGSPQWSLSPQVYPPKPCTRLSPSNPRYMPRPAHYSRFYHPHNSGWSVQITKLH
jgi:hypothetical protein